jgi:TPR repeat protein
MNSNVLEFSKSIGKLQTIISLLHNGLKKKVVRILKQEKLNNEIKEFKRLDFSKCSRFINEKWSVFSKHFDPDFKKLSKRSIEIRNSISHQDISKIDFERDLETLIKFATLIDSNELKNQIKTIINDQQSSEDFQNKSGEWYEMKEKGNEHFKIGNFTEALIFYTKAIKLDNKQASLYSNRALCELKLEKFELARQDSEDAIDLEPNNVKYYRILSEALMKLELYEESIQICELGLKIDSYEETLLLRKRDLNSRIEQKKTDFNNPRKDFKDFNNIELQEMQLNYEKKLNNLNPRTCDIENLDDIEKFFDRMKLTRLVKDAHSYFDGIRGKNKDIGKAIEIFKHAANNGNAEGMYNLGVIYGREIAGIVDYSRMLEYFNLAASQKAFYKIHKMIFNNLGVSEAENGLGNSYRDGRGVDIDFKKAFNHYLRSAEFGYPEGQNNVGIFLKNGNGVKTNHEYAREWFRKAAEQNIAEAQFNYAEMLANGEGGPVKETEAIEYYKKAAEQGSPYALEKLQSLAFANKSYSSFFKNN